MEVNSQDATHFPTAFHPTTAPTPALMNIGLQLPSNDLTTLPQPTGASLPAKHHTGDTGASTSTPQDHLPSCIPDLSCNPEGYAVQMTEHWKMTVLQWFFGDVKHGLMVLLHDWLKDWYTGLNTSKFEAKCSQRRVIAEEYQKYIHVLSFPASQG